MGTNLKAYEKLGKIGVNIIVSGGIGSMAELETLQSIVTWGAILGKSLYAGELDLRTVISEFGGRFNGQ